MKAIEPLNDNVVIELQKENDVSPGGIFLPDSAKKNSRTGTVLAVAITSPIPLPVKCGDIVVIAEYSGTELNLGNDLTVTIVNVKDILVRLP